MYMYVNIYWFLLQFMFITLEVKRHIIWECVKNMLKNMKWMFVPENLTILDFASLSELRNSILRLREMFILTNSTFRLSISLRVCSDQAGSFSWILPVVNVLKRILKTIKQDSITNSFFQWTMNYMYKKKVCRNSLHWGLMWNKPNYSTASQTVGNIPINTGQSYQDCIQERHQCLASFDFPRHRDGRCTGRSQTWPQ